MGSELGDGVGSAVNAEGDGLGVEVGLASLLAALLGSALGLKNIKPCFLQYIGQCCVMDSQMKEVVSFWHDNE